jgi:hypothetical protein
MRHRFDHGTLIGNLEITLSAGVSDRTFFDKTLPKKFFDGDRYEFMIASGRATVTEIRAAYDDLHRDGSSSPLQAALIE